MGVSRIQDYLQHFDHSIVRALSSGTWLDDVFAALRSSSKLRRIPHGKLSADGIAVSKAAGVIRSSPFSEQHWDGASFS